VSNRLRQRMTYANVMSTLAVFIALGGSSYAAVRINGKSIKNRSIAAAKLKRNSLTGREIRESRLGRVPWAATADRLGRLRSTQLTLHCPADTFLVANTCFEKTPRDPTTYGSARLQCLTAGGSHTFGRRLPTYDELVDGLTARTVLKLAPGGELTANVYPSTAAPGKVDDLVVVTDGGGVSVIPDTPPNGDRQYRCVTDPINGPS
jgi:hypothetical protein